MRDANRWHQAKILRDYIYAIEAKLSNYSTVPPYLQEWIDWVKGNVETYDPLCNALEFIIRDYYQENGKENLLDNIR